MQSDTHIANSQTVNGHMLLLAIAGSVGKFENQAVRVGGDDDRRLYRRAEREFDANIIPRVNDLQLLDVRRRKRLSYGIRHPKQPNAELYSHCPHFV